jgi:hypothetical protein
VGRCVFVGLCLLTQEGMSGLVYECACLHLYVCVCVCDRQCVCVCEGGRTCAECQRVPRTVARQINRENADVHAYHTTTSTLGVHFARDDLVCWFSVNEIGTTENL